MDTAQEARLLIGAVLRSRNNSNNAGAGAAREELAQAVLWGRSVRAEAQALVAARKPPARGGTGTRGGNRQRSNNTSRRQELAQREQSHELNQALLDGVLSGTIGLDVRGGTLLFLHGGAYIGADEELRALVSSNGSQNCQQNRAASSR